jgi:hypothetical protein
MLAPGAGGLGNRAWRRGGGGAAQCETAAARAVPSPVRSPGPFGFFLTNLCTCLTSPRVTLSCTQVVMARPLGPGNTGAEGREECCAFR